MTEKIVNLVVVAHPDDEILGFGGAGAKLAARGEIVQPIILCGSVDARTQRPHDDELAEDIRTANQTVGFAQPLLGNFPNIRINTVPHLELVQFIEEQVVAYRPTRIFTHHPSDLNDDHNMVSRSCMAASRLFQRRADIPALRSLHFMEILSSTDWAFPDERRPFQPNEFVEINEHLETKIAALHCYRKVMRDFPHSRSVETVTGLAALRGSQCGLGYAEAFQTVFSTQLN
jgi:N-acetylglucosamine malate deacetylase 1